jgi:hypothetical protein
MRRLRVNIHSSTQERQTLLLKAETVRCEGNRERAEEHVQNPEDETRPDIQRECHWFASNQLWRVHHSH